MRKTPTYNSWANMKQRCNNPKNDRYEDWGGRGISYDPRWESFDLFLGDMGTRPIGHTLDRIDNDKDYSKENCRWSDQSSQSLNTRLRKDNSVGERNISPTGYGYRVNIYRNKKAYVSLTVKTVEEAVELRDLALESLEGI